MSIQPLYFIKITDWTDGVKEINYWYQETTMNFAVVRIRHRTDAWRTGKNMEKSGYRTNRKAENEITPLHTVISSCFTEL